MTECTQTWDEQSPLPYKPFPKKPYFKPILDAIDNEARVFIEKSRTMMISWLVSAYCSHRAFTNDANVTVFQSQDEARSVKDVMYCKELWRNSIPQLRERWPLAKELEKQPYNTFELANRSKFIGIAGNPDRLRSEHPTVVVLDEASIMVYCEQIYNIALATHAPKIILISSAKPGWFFETCESGTPVDWPRYEKEAVA